VCVAKSANEPIFEERPCLLICLKYNPMVSLADALMRKLGEIAL